MSHTIARFSPTVWPGLVNGCAGSNSMDLTFILVVVAIALCAALVAWYYSRECQSVRYEYLGLERSGMSGQVDSVYRSIVRPLRRRRLIALCVATMATCAAIALIGLQNA